MTVGRGCLSNLVGDSTIETVESQTEYLDYFMRNIQSFGLSLICGVSNKNEIRKIFLELAKQ